MKDKKFQIVELVDGGVKYSMRLNAREKQLYELLVATPGTLVTFDVIKEKTGMDKNLSRVTKFSLSSKLPVGFEISTVYGQGYFISKSEGAGSED